VKRILIWIRLFCQMLYVNYNERFVFIMCEFYEEM